MCSFCDLLQQRRESDKKFKENKNLPYSPEQYKTEYSVALCVYSSIVLSDDDEIPTGNIKYCDKPLNFCPECGKKLDFTK